MVPCLGLITILATAQNSNHAKSTKPSDTKPSLNSTLKMIQDGVNDQGEIRYTMTSRNTASGETVQDQYVVETSNAVADSNSCTLQVDARMTLNGSPQLQGRAALEIRRIDSLIVKSQSQAIEQKTKQSGVTQWTGKIAPESYMIQAFQSDSLVGILFFRERDTANAIAQKIGRAVELCTGKTPTVTMN
ncbi:MAG TPA: hypothetical protein VMD78_01565 [Candidatus Baltobacteraceae bacterium]|nr:hypothetical protein [Candidatus Baltobacteraceae bacterium]